MHRLREADLRPGHRRAVLARGSLGRGSLVSKAGVYRAIPRLEQLGLVQTLGQQRAEDVPPHWIITASRAGRTATRVWLRTPVAHGREVRSELMIKLALLDRAGDDSQDLLRRQLAAFAPSPRPWLTGCTTPPEPSTRWRYGSTR